MDCIYMWADGAWCEGDELETYLGFKSDDYHTVPVGDDETYEEAADRFARSIGAY